MTVLDWLLDADPALRWQVLRDLLQAPAAVVAAERAQVAAEGWMARLLALRRASRPRLLPCGRDGAWLLEHTHPGKVHFALEDGDGRPSRWNTLRALRLLRWYEQSTT